MSTLESMSNIVSDEESQAQFEEDVGAVPAATQVATVPKPTPPAPSAAARAKDWFKAPSWSNGPARWKVTVGAGAAVVAASFVMGWFGFKKRL